MIEVKDLGLKPYREIWDMQHQLQQELISQGAAPKKEYLLLVEHNPVYTLGIHGHEQNMLLDHDRLQAMGAELIKIERGGDITFHGPGQLVVYPIINLLNHHLGVKDYVHLLEEAVIRTVAEYGVTGDRVEGATGVWLDKGLPSERKICAIGIKCSRFVTMHGLALNVNTDLSYFHAINPCGFIDKGVTSIAQELGQKIDMGQVKKTFTNHFLTLLNSK